MQGRGSVDCAMSMQKQKNYSFFFERGKPLKGPDKSLIRFRIRDETADEIATA
jgi:hypothetical protein